MMKTPHHPYLTRIKNDYWLDLLSVQEFTTKSINTLLNEGVREVVRKTKQEMGQYRKDRETIRSVSNFR
jgi:hypothetical protein